jgi:hypothetical protein
MSAKSGMTQERHALDSIRPFVCVSENGVYSIHPKQHIKEGKCSLATRSRGLFSEKQTHRLRASLFWFGWLWKHSGRAGYHLQKHTPCMEESSAYTVHVEGTSTSTYFNYSYQRECWKGCIPNMTYVHLNMFKVNAFLDLTGMHELHSMNLNTKLWQLQVRPRPCFQQALLHVAVWLKSLNTRVYMCIQQISTPTHTHTSGIIIEGQGAISGYQRQHMFIPDHLTTLLQGRPVFSWRQVLPPNPSALLERLIQHQDAPSGYS